VIESELHEWDKAGPEIEREGDVNRGECGDDVVFSCAHVASSRVGTMIVGRDKLYNAGDRRR
jgi:hypothetical protein